MSNNETPRLSGPLAGSPPSGTRNADRRPVNTGSRGRVAIVHRVSHLLLPSLLILSAAPAIAARDDCVGDAPLDSLARAALQDQRAPKDMTLCTVDEEVGGNHDNSVRDRPFRYWYRDSAGRRWAVQLTAHNVIAVYPP